MHHRSEHLEEVKNFIYEGFSKKEILDMGYTPMVYAYANKEVNLELSESHKKVVKWTKSYKPAPVVGDIKIE